jgi:hypothetical protein
MGTYTYIPGVGGKESETGRKFYKIVFEFLEFCRVFCHRTAKRSGAHLSITENGIRSRIKRNAILLITGLRGNLQETQEFCLLTQP